MLEVYTNNEKHKLLEESKMNLSFLTQQENILLNIDEPREEQDEYLTFSEGKYNSEVETTNIARDVDLDCSEENENLNEDIINIDEI